MQITIRVTKIHMVRHVVSPDPSKGILVAKVTFQIHVSERESYLLNEVEVTQSGGMNFATDPIEVGRPRFYGYPYGFNAQAFREGVEQAYRNVVGETGRRIHLGGSATNYMADNVFQIDHAFVIEVEKSGATSW